MVGALQNESGLAEPVDPACRSYHSRPFQVLHAERFARALSATVTDPELRGRPLTGSVDQWADSTGLLNLTGPVRAATRALGQRPSTGPPADGPKRPEALPDEGPKARGAGSASRSRPPGPPPGPALT
ncbi:hypothetical protein [Streptomyces sp. NPDC102264]|uniref:hypothetical protein n=1 Tax=Streptomyces sp. NPDC102264 TaxID=3366149 RepID=UPI00382E0203